MTILQEECKTKAENLMAEYLQDKTISNDEAIKLLRLAAIIANETLILCKNKITNL